MAENRKLRSLDPAFRYGVSRTAHEIRYTDADGREIVLYGELHAPVGGGAFPAVILCHGFNGHCTDFPLECKRFAERGYVCYAFDFCGAQSGGRSVGRGAEDYTPYTMAEDLKTAVADIKTLANVDASQVFLFGGSQGGFVTGLTAASPELTGQIAAIAMYFPAFNIPDDWRRAPIRSTPLMGYSIGAGYIESIRDLHPFDVIGDFTNDVCIVWGDRDPLVAGKYIDGAVAAYGKDRVALTVLPGAGHGFGGGDLDRAVSAVLAFLEAHTYEAEK